ncbi:MAG TPA: type 1 glutamine amidotransferase domain-containing protein [Candidatus Limnocylindrales bacterium]|nr:type 1 glutamine amidotransferase domain-containing protein [Candidatus Limnocylindrales bacterium]
MVFGLLTPDYGIMELSGKKVLIFAADEYEDLELWYPKLRLTEAGAKVTVAGLGEKVYKGRKGYPVEVDTDVSQCRAADFDAVVIPGGFAPDRLRRSEQVLTIVRDAFETGKVVAAICHAGWVPVSAGIVKGKRMTCVSAIKDDVKNAGAEYVDQPVVVDGNLITSRVPADLPDFCREIIKALAK